MSFQKISRLTPEQETLIPFYRQKWEKIAYDTRPSDREKAKSAIQTAYAVRGKKEPQIIFLQSINEAKLILLSHSYYQEQLGEILTPLSVEIIGDLYKQFENFFLWQRLHQQLMLNHPLMTMLMQLLTERLSDSEIAEILAKRWEQQQIFVKEQLQKLPGGDWFLELGDSFWSNLVEPAWEQIGEPILKEISKTPLMQVGQEIVAEFLFAEIQIENEMRWMYGWYPSAFEASFVAIIDYCYSVLECDRDDKKWSALQSLVLDCGWVFPFENICFVCDRPTKLSFDEENRLHAEGEAALQFADGYRIYSYHGVTLPEKYGAIHPHNWRASWLLEEENAELKRVLIQGISYGRICQELDAIELDSWREYTLLLIDDDVDVEPIYLLKMTCPSTGHIHALRIPPYITTAREAIAWTNWDIDPEEFSIES
jgi:hypothetical protein